MVYVTHDQTEAMTMSDRVAVFSDGRIAQIGAPLAVYHRPASRFVGEFIGDSNFLPGRIGASRPDLLELDGIGQVRVAPDASPQAGAVDLLLRPERLRLRPADAGEHDNVFELTIRDIIHYGDSTLLIGKAGGLALRARLAGSEAGRLREGMTVKLYWSPADGHILRRAE
jgi:putative spermidine/putrescine transport system ATP-binding protein